MEKRHSYILLEIFAHHAFTRVDTQGMFYFADRT